PAPAGRGPRGHRAGDRTFDPERDVGRARGDRRVGRLQRRDDRDHADPDVAPGHAVAPPPAAEGGPAAENGAARHRAHRGPQGDRAVGGRAADCRAQAGDAERAGRASRRRDGRTALMATLVAERPRVRDVRLPAWPLTGILLLYPLWWLLGLGVLAFYLVAAPMAVLLIRRRLAGHRLRLPPGFVLWLLFLTTVALG